MPVNPYIIILAPNPSLMTGPGTNTIVLAGGAAGAVVIDPACDNPEHLAAIIHAGSEYGGIRRILITHGHPDHVGGAAELRERLGAPIYAWSRAGVPLADEEVSDGMLFPVEGDTLRAIYTPGHRFDHLCFLLEQQRVLFAGDLLAGVGTVVIAPPEGDMYDYLRSLKYLQDLDIAEILPAHGPVIAQPQAKLAEYIAHRQLREQQIIDSLQRAPSGIDITTIVQGIYTDVDPRLHAAAARSVLAHLLKLEREGRVRHVGKDTWSAIHT